MSYWLLLGFIVILIDMPVLGINSRSSGSALHPSANSPASWLHLQSAENWIWGCWACGNGELATLESDTHTKKYTNRFPGTFLIQLYIYMEVLFLKQSWHIQVTKFIGVNVVGAGRWDWYKGIVRSLWNKWLQTSDQFSKLGKSGDILKNSVSDSSPMPSKRTLLFHSTF